MHTSPSDTYSINYQFFTMVNLHVWPGMKSTCIQQTSYKLQVHSCQKRAEEAIVSIIAGTVFGKACYYYFIAQSETRWTCDFCLTS